MQEKINFNLLNGFSSLFADNLKGISKPQMFQTHILAFGTTIGILVIVIVLLIGIVIYACNR